LWSCESTSQGNEETKAAFSPENNLSRGVRTVNRRVARDFNTVRRSPVGVEPFQARHGALG